MRRLAVVLSLLLVGVVAVALVAYAARPQPSPSSTPSPAAQEPAQQPTVMACHLRGPLPDPNCTPGAADPAVTQADIATTICVSGYTKTVRPPASYTDALKLTQMTQYGLAGTTADYEEDHLIPLEIGGSPRDPRNLWPEPRATLDAAGGAEVKDKLENRLHELVCSGDLPLAKAQKAIASDWVAAYREYVSP